MEENLKHCFVIQPFNDVFNNRYQDIFEPAIRDAGLEPYRVDKDPSVDIPIDSIHEGIKDSAICLADITLDNPNVWYELGYALASGKTVIMLCGKEREGNKYPFDVQHLTIIGYKLSSLPDYGDLKEKISTRIQATLLKQAKIKQIVQSPLKAIEGLEPYETTALALAMENSIPPDGGATWHDINSSMISAGYLKLTSNLAIESLMSKGLLVAEWVQADYGDAYVVYKLTLEGKKWLLHNRDKLLLVAPKTIYPDDDYDDSDPFADE
jgi:hypothetical protein